MIETKRHLRLRRCLFVWAYYYDVRVKDSSEPLFKIETITNNIGILRISVP